MTIHRTVQAGKRLIKRLVRGHSWRTQHDPPAFDESLFPLIRPNFGPEKSPLPVPVSSVAPFHNSIGDISTAEITQQYLAHCGVPSYLTSFWDHDHKHLVIGGGEIIGTPERGAWMHVKPLFLPRGEHVLNAVGVRDVAGKDLDVLREYRYVSVRDYEGAEILTGNGRPEVQVVPCPATLQPGIPLKILKGLPRYEVLSQLRETEYVVVHRHPSLRAIARRLVRKGYTVVVVDMQAHALHQWGRTGTVLPSTHSSLVIQGLVRSAAAVLTSSLHLAIFAIGAATPFAAIDTSSGQSRKIQRYLRRAGLGDKIVKDPDLEVALDDRQKLIRVSESEKRLALQHLQKIVASLTPAQG